MNNNAIDFSSEVFISNLGNFDDLDTCIVLGNLLDNAIDVCLLNTIKEHKKITLSIKEDDSCIKILVMNIMSIYNYYSSHKLKFDLYCLKW